MNNEQMQAVINRARRYHTPDSALTSDSIIADLLDVIEQLMHDHESERPLNDLDATNALTISPVLTQPQILTLRLFYNYSRKGNNGGVGAYIKRREDYEVASSLKDLGLLLEDNGQYFYITRKGSLWIKDYDALTISPDQP